MQQDAEKLIAENIGLVFLQLNKLCLRGDPEAESIGYEALFRASSTYDSTKDVKFSTYASVCIYNALGSYIRTLKKQRQLDVVSYNNIIGDSKEARVEFLDLLPSADNVESTYLHQEELKVIYAAYCRVYNSLTNDKHKQILSMWYENNCAVTTVQIASSLNVSQSYVSQVLSRSKNLLRIELEGLL